MLDAIRTFFSDNIDSPAIVTAILLVATFLVAILCYYITKKLLDILERLVLRSPTDWDDDLLNNRFLRALSQLAPAICVNWMLPGWFSDNERVFGVLSTLTSIYIVTTVVYIVCIFLSNLYNAMSYREKTRSYAIKGVFQMVKLIVICIGAIIGISILIGKSPVAILTALGASAAVLMLVFQDTILGLVASVQLTANKMLHKGDWIVSDKHGVNGEVLDVSLTTIKVKNWDNSVSTIPPYSLISGSFRNYEAMRLSGGRRVDRSIYIDVNTVRFLEPAEIEALKADGWLEGIANAGRIVNLGLLRRYLENWLKSNELVNPELTLMVRQMEPTPSGLPLQLYFFTKTVEWTSFEAAQSEIFDHVYAVVNRFGLSIFQTPAGSDIRKLKN